MKKKDFETSLRNGTLKYEGNLFSNLPDAQKEAKRKGSDYVVVNLTNNTIVKDSINDMSVPLEKVDAKNYVVNHAGVWFAKPLGQRDNFTEAFYSTDEGKTWHKATMEKKSSNGSNGRTQSGKIFFRSSNPRTSIGRNVLTWYSNNNKHDVDYSLEIDHIDEDYTNDRLDNLQRITPAENKAKRGKK